MDDYFRNCLLDIIATLESGNPVCPQSTQHEQIMTAIRGFISDDDIKNNRITIDYIDEEEYVLEEASELFKTFI